MPNMPQRPHSYTTSISCVPSLQKVINYETKFSSTSRDADSFQTLVSHWEKRSNVKNNFSTISPVSSNGIPFKSSFSINQGTSFSASIKSLRKSFFLDSSQSSYSITSSKSLPNDDLAVFHRQASNERLIQRQSVYDPPNSNYLTEVSKVNQYVSLVKLIRPESERRNANLIYFLITQAPVMIAIGHSFFFFYNNTSFFSFFLLAQCQKRHVICKR